MSWPESEAADLDEFEEGGLLQAESPQTADTTEARGRPAVQDMTAACSRLEHSSEFVEAQLRRDPTQFPRDLSEAQ
jgi:hypothetical protein